MAQDRLRIAAFTLPLLAIGGGSAVFAQGPVYREQWSYLHLEARRLEVVRELAERDAETIAAVARLLAEPASGAPFTPVARALAHLRSVPTDELFLLRCAVGAFVLPEIADPVASNEACRAVNVSMFLPYSLPAPLAIEFAVAVYDAAGKTVCEQRVDRDTGIGDLRMARATAAIDTAQLPDGEYHVSVRTIVDGKEPRLHDPVLRWRCHVLRGYQARAEAALAAVREGLPANAVARAQLQGLAAVVLRAYTGEPFVVASDGVRELERLEQALRNVAAERPVLTALRGDIATALPAEGGALPCVLRLHADERPRPLVVFAAATPAYDTNSLRPMGPATRGPGWLAAELRSFASDRPWHVAFVDSPGAGRNYVPALRSALAALAELLPSGGTKPVLVCDREAAAAVGFRAADLRPLLSGLVLAGAGAMPKAQLDAIGELPVRCVPLHAYPSADGLRRVADLAASKRREGSTLPDLTWLTERTLPWTCGLPLLQKEIEEFAAHAFAR